MYIQLSGIVNDSVVDGPGLRFVVFTQGCPHKCEGCHNPDTHAFTGGTTVNVDKLYHKIKENPLIQGVTFSGGEPFSQPEPLLYLAQLLKADGYHLMCYTGFTFEQLLHLSHKNQAIADLLSLIDILVDGRFEIEHRNLLLKFRGSTNQRILDCKTSYRLQKAIETEI